MNKLALLTMSVLAIPFTGAAAIICPSGTLTTYVALSSGGCTIAGTAITVSNFSATFAVPTGSTAIAPGSITVTPVAGPTPSLQFGVNATSGARQVNEILFSYNVTAPSITGTSLAMSGFSPSLDGGVTDAEAVCEGANFTAGMVAGCGTPGVRQNLSTFAVTGLSQTTDQATFRSVGSLNVIDDIAVDGGTTGTSSLNGPVTNGFTASATAVPEPSTVLLFSAGLCGLGLLRRRVLR